MMKENFCAMLVLVAILFVGAVQFCSGGNTSFSCIEREREALLKLKLCFNDSSHMLSSWKGNDCCEWRGVGCDKSSSHVVSLQLRGSISDDQHKLYLIDNNVQEVVSSLLKLRYLEHLDLSGNDFNCSLIPPFFGLMKQLRHLNLSNMHFRGRIPSELGNLTRLRVLDLSNGALEVDDHIQWISHLSSLQQLDMSRVSLSNASSNLFQVLGMLPSLSWISLSNCHLNNSHLLFGSHPLNFTFFRNVQHFDLSLNSFQGPIPIFLRNITSLTFINLSRNEFGLMVDWLGDLKRLRYLDLSWNAFVGSIPSSLGTISTLRELYLSGNKLNETIPMWIGKLLAIRKLILYSNQLRGSVPNSIGQLSELEMIDFSKNLLSGSIPNTIGQLSKLEIMDLSENQLSGSIPNSMSGSHKLSHLNLSYNNLSGPIPIGNQLQTLKDPTIYVGNPQLCGAPLMKKCLDDVLPPTTT
ncbi:hypothetical protein SLEP1_g39871 [Rubroshorea leprosula]|uniref:Leucine-rich repeat-containing N-terminal plant-type domain-containing protein n=1 Tax=Rubroshorea leprosula TaxID=152421 RepID=A0AAV5L2V5_9ROSI|nr:hypothetical protein SLEP1_g39871 [Rubroshorea leprosula]